MPRESNPTRRVVQILDHMTAEPDRAFGVSELARMLGMNKATCLTVLGTLTSSGYLLQEPVNKAYTLGPAAVALGSAATVRFPALAEARSHMRALSTETNLLCLAWTAEAAQVVVLESYGIPDPMDPIIGIGRRSPLAPPFGVSHAAWMPPREFERWLGRAQPPVTPEELREIRTVMGFVGAHGYMVTLHTSIEKWLSDVTWKDDDPAAAWQRAMDTALPALRENDAYLVAAVEPRTRYPVGNITAPVFGADGRPVLHLLLQGFREPLSGDEIHRYGRSLVKHAREVSTSIAGRPPEFRKSLAPPAHTAAS